MPSFYYVSILFLQDDKEKLFSKSYGFDIYVCIIAVNASERIYWNMNPNLFIANHKIGKVGGTNANSSDADGSRKW